MDTAVVIVQWGYKATPPLTLAMNSVLLAAALEGFATPPRIVKYPPDSVPKRTSAHPTKIGKNANPPVAFAKPSPPAPIR